MTTNDLIKKVLTIKGILILLFLFFSVSVLGTLPQMPSESEIDSTSWSEYEKIITLFETDDRKLIDQAEVELNRYFAEMERNIDPFLDDLYSFSSKGKMLWYLLKDMELKNVEGIPPYLMMLPLLVPVRTGTHLPDFIEGKFNAHFGSTAEVNRIVSQVSSDLSRELAGNNERLAMELGELVPATLKKPDELADKVNERCKFADRAKQLSTTIMVRTSGLQTGIEIAFLTGCEAVIAKPVAAYIVTIMVAEGLLVAEGIGSGIVTFGVGTAIMIAVDVVANNISKSTLKPKIREALSQRRRETLVTFRKSLLLMVDDFHRTRRNTIEKTLNVGFLFKLKNCFSL